MNATTAANSLCLADEIALLAAQVDVGMHRLLTCIRRFDESEEWARARSAKLRRVAGVADRAGSGRGAGEGSRRAGARAFRRDRRRDVHGPVVVRQGSGADPCRDRRERGAPGRDRAGDHRRPAGTNLPAVSARRRRGRAGRRATGLGSVGRRARRSGPHDGGRTGTDRGDAGSGRGGAGAGGDREGTRRAARRDCDHDARFRGNAGTRRTTTRARSGRGADRDRGADAGAPAITRSRRRRQPPSPASGRHSSGSGGARP